MKAEILFSLAGLHPQCYFEIPQCILLWIVSSTLGQFAATPKGIDLKMTYMQRCVVGLMSRKKNIF